jgi:hypothetical protein
METSPLNETLRTQLRDGLANPLPFRDARDRWRALRTDLGLTPGTPRLLTWPNGNAKLRKGGQYGLSLLPHRLGGPNVCAWSTPQCRKLCLNTAGRGSSTVVHNGRHARTQLLFTETSAFATLLRREVFRLPKGAALRMNTFSDVPWESVWPEFFSDLASTRPDMQVYDYTKAPIGSRQPPSNYHLTFSASEKWSESEIADAVNDGHNVTVVLNLRRSEGMPSSWKGLPVVDGDKNDARYDDPKGVVVGLRAKGRAFRSDSAFVRNP